MGLPEASVRRPVTVLVATAAITLFGYLSMIQLPLDLLPDMAYPTLTIQTVYADAAPVSVEQFVTRPVEEAVGVIPGVRDMRSVSRAGVSEVVLEFEWDEPMDFAAIDVREKLGLVELPRDVDPPRVLRFDPSLDPIVRLAFGGDRSLDDLREIAERWVKPRLEAVRGVAAAKVRGGLETEIQVDGDEDRLAAMGLTLDDLALALREENVNRPGGVLKDWGTVYLVRTLNEFEDLDHLRRTVVRDSAEGRVRIEDVAEVRRGYRDRVEVTRFDGQESIEIAVHREGAANTIAVAEAVAKEIAALREDLSAGLELTVLSDQSAYIVDAVGQVRSAALLGGLLAVLVLYFFLRDPKATAIIGISIPISVLAAFLPMLKAGVSLNIMSLGGLALGVGMLVDNSIVVLEAIDRHLREGLGRREAAALGGGEVAGAVTASTLTTVSVFFPILFVRGIAGQLFYDLAVTVCLSLLASLAVALTLIPALAAFEFGLLPRESPNRLFGWSNDEGTPETRRGTVRIAGLVFPPVGGDGWPSRILSAILLPFRLVWRLVVLAAIGIVRGLLWGLFKLVFAVWWGVSWAFHILAWPLARLIDQIGAVYARALPHAIRGRWVVLPVAIALFVLSLMSLSSLGTQLVPDLSQGEFAFQLDLAEGTTLESTVEMVERIEGRLRESASFATIFSTVGSLPSTASGRRTAGENLAQINFRLPEGSPPGAELAAVEEVRSVLAIYPSVEAELVLPSVLSVRPPIAVNLFSENLELLDVAAVLTANLLATLNGVEDVATTSEPGGPEITIEVNREMAAELGVSPDALARSLRSQIRGEVVGQFREEERRFDIRLRAAEGARDRATRIEELRFRLPGGATVPLSSVARVEVGRGPAAIHRVGGARVAQVSAKVAGGDLGNVLASVGDAIRNADMPPGVEAELAGQDEELRVSFDSLKMALGLAVFLVYVVMAMQFESFRYPFVILVSVPLGLVGVVAALRVTNTTLNVLVLIGLVMLAGIVVNNAIVLVDAVNRRRREGQSIDDALIGAGKERLRPILMTTLTTVLALLPMALGLGAGDELRRPMAVTVIGGLTGATLLTLLVIPCMYRVFSGRQASLGLTDPDGALLSEAMTGTDEAAL